MSVLVTRSLKRKRPKRLLWEDLDLDYWAPIQTCNPPKEPAHLNWYAGFDTLASPHWSEFVQCIPLGIRYESFSRRLEAVQAKRA